MSQSKAVVEREGEVPAVVSEGAAILSMIERAARDPTVDIEKMRQLMDMRLQMEARAAEREFDIAMSEAQREMRAVATDASNPQTRSKYASYFALDEALRPIYTDHGFSLTFDTADGAPEGFVRIVAKVAHSGGHRERPHLDMPADGKGAKGGDVMTKTHATGSAITYGKRYLLSMIFNIAVGKDDDGNSAGSGEKISEEQAKQVRSLIDETGTDIERFCKYQKIESIPDLPVAKFNDAVTALEKKRARK